MSGFGRYPPLAPLCRLPDTKSHQDEHEIVPRDTETRTFLHDIPILRQSELATTQPRHARLLGNRKGIVVEGIGIIANGALTVEQAYINWSSVFHSTYIKYLEDVLENGFLLPGEEQAFSNFRNEWLLRFPPMVLQFRPGPITDKAQHSG